MAHRDDPRVWYNNSRDRLNEAIEDGTVSQEDGEQIKEVLDALDEDYPGKVFQTNGERKTLASKTLSNYVTRFRLLAGELDDPLLEQDTESINKLMGDLATGRAEVAPSDGYAKGTVGQ